MGAGAEGLPHPSSLGVRLARGEVFAGVELEAPAKWLPPAACAGLLLLTVAVTPANIYMYTHGATMGTGPLPLTFHYIRFAVQCVLLGLLATLAKDSFFYAWGDEIE